MLVLETEVLLKRVVLAALARAIVANASSIFETLVLLPSRYHRQRTMLAFGALKSLVVVDALQQRVHYIVVEERLFILMIDVRVLYDFLLEVCHTDE